jgi:hypothetical protein
MPTPAIQLVDFVVEIAKRVSLSQEKKYSIQKKDTNLKKKKKEKIFRV